MKLLETHKRFLIGMTSLVVLCSFWQLIGQLGFINPMFFGWPSTIAIELYKILANGLLFPNLSTTFLELFLGIALACLAIPLGLAMGRSKTLEYSLDPIVSAFNAMPRIAFMPLLILVFGLGLMSKVILVLVGCFFPILVNVFHGMKNVDPLMIDMARVFGAKRIFMAREVFLPSILPFLIAGFRIAFALGLIMVVVGEFLAGNLGVGYMIATEAGYYHASAVMAWVLIIAAISIFLTELIRYYENRMKYWK